MKGDVKTTDQYGNERTCVSCVGGLPPVEEREWSLRVAEAIGEAAADELRCICEERGGTVPSGVAISAFMTALNQLVFETVARENRPETWSMIRSLVDQIVASDVS